MAYPRGRGAQVRLHADEQNVARGGTGNLLMDNILAKRVMEDTGQAADGDGPDGSFGGRLALDEVLLPGGILDWIDPGQFGAVGDGVANDRAALQAAIDAVYVRGGGEILITKRHLVEGGDLVVRDGVTLVGPWRGGGQMQGADYSDIAPAIILDPAYTIRLMRHAVVTGFAVLRKGLFAPTTLRDCFRIQNEMAGTAIVLGDAVNYGSQAYGSGVATGANANIAADAKVLNMFILGFDLAIYSDFNNRITIRDVYGDCRNGTLIRRCYDVPRFENIHFWPYLTGNTVAAMGRFDVTACTAGTGNLIRLTTAQAHGLQPGDWVNIRDISGVPGAAGRKTISAVSTYWIELAGTAFSGAPVFGATPQVIVWGNRRSGTCFTFESIDWGTLIGSFGYAFDRGFYAHDAVVGMALLGVAFDDHLDVQDTEGVGFDWNGGVYWCSVRGISTSSYHTAIKHRPTNGGRVVASGGLLGGTQVANAQNIQILGGSLELEGVEAAGCNAYIADAATAFRLAGGSFGGVTAQSAASYAKLFRQGQASSAGNSRYTAASTVFDEVGTGGTRRRMELNPDGRTILGARGFGSGNGSRLDLTRATDGATVAVLSVGGGNTPSMTLAGDGTNNPSAPLQVGGVGASTAAQAVYPVRQDPNITAASAVGILGFQASNQGGAATVQYAGITAVADGITAGAEKGRLDVGVLASGTYRVALRVSESRAQVFQPLQVAGYAVADLPPATDYATPAVVYCSNGDGGNPCLAVAVAGVWRRLPWTTPVSAS